MIKAPTGTRDILPEDVKTWQRIEKTAGEIFTLYGYEEIRTPIFESTSLFQRSIGEATDIVEKEMYTFKDKGGRSLTLRPEGTAPVVRAYLEHQFPQRDQFQKFYYIGPMFRYERPQKGRFRQFHQVGIEVFGPNHPMIDVEVIAIQWRIFKELDVSDLKVKINSLGCEKCRPGYRKALIEHLKKNRERLCETCQRRLERNPLRVLDCKNPGCQQVVREGPKITDYLCNDCREHMKKVTDGLESLKIPYEVDPFLVRGLDYYTKTVFEFIHTALGAQNTVSAGGRYDNLVEELGGPEIPGIGFALGIERLVLILNEKGLPEEKKPLYFIPLGEEAIKEGIKIMEELRDSGIPVIWTGKVASIKAQLRQANKRGADRVLILGESEIENREIKLKDMKEGREEVIKWKDLKEHLRYYF